MPGHASTYWEGLPPAQLVTHYNETLVTYNNDAHAEVALSANLYRLEKDYPYLGSYEFSIPVVAVANSRRNMGYSVSYHIGDIPSRSETLTLGDNEGAWVDIGDSFWFYGAWYTRVWITSNGFVTFDNRSYNDNGEKWTSPNPTSIPTTDDPNTILAPFWRDLDPSQGGTIEYGMGITGYFAVIWRNIPNKANGNTQTFALYFGTFVVRSTHINFVYGSITNDVPTSIGIEDQTGKQGESVASSMSSRDKVEFTDESNNHYDITEIKVSASKLNVSGVNDEEALIYIQGMGDSRPGGTNVILDDPSEGKYSVPPIFTAATFALSTAGLLGPGAFAYLGYAGYVISAGTLAVELSPMPRGTTVHEADEYTKTAYVQSAARDENYPSKNLAHDVSISPLIRWQILNPSSYHHKLVITAEVTIKRPDGTTYTLTTTTPLEINLGTTTLHLVMSYEDYYTTPSPVLDSIQEDLEKIGINIVIDTRYEWEMGDIWQGWGGWDRTWDEDPGDGWDMIWYTYDKTFEDLMSYYLANATPPYGGFNIMNWNNEAADSLLTRGMGADDAVERQQWLWQWQEEFMHDPPGTVIYYPSDPQSAKVMVFNLRHPILSNRYVRQAIAHAINRDKIINEILPTYDIEAFPNAKAPVLPWWYYHGVQLFNTALSHTYNVTKAQAYMDRWKKSQVGSTGTVYPGGEYLEGAAGDADFSGKVDLDDFYIWRDEGWPLVYPETVTFLPGQDIDPDFNNDGSYDYMPDYPIWSIETYDLDYP